MVQVWHRVLHRGETDQQERESDDELSDVAVPAALEGHHKETQGDERNGERSDVVAESEQGDHPRRERRSDVRSHNHAYGVAQCEQTGVDHTDDHHGRSAGGLDEGSDDNTRDDTLEGR